MPEQVVASDQSGQIIHHGEWNTLELSWLPATADPAPDGPATFPTGWFKTRDAAYQWLAAAPPAGPAAG